MAEDIVDPHPLIEVIAEAVRKALPKACSANGTIDEYTIARAVYATAEITALRKLLERAVQDAGSYNPGEWYHEARAALGERTG